METKKLTRGNARLIAHRGLSGLERENSAAAFIAAGNRPYWGIETDLRKTADGVFVTIHDSMTGRVADRDVCVEDCTYEELQQVHLKNISGDCASRTDLRIPTLGDYLEICHKYSKVAVLELKTLFDRQTMLDMLDVIRAHNHLEQTVFISFLWEDLVPLRELLPDHPMQYLTNQACTDELFQQLLHYHFDLDIEYHVLMPETIQRLHRAGRVVNAWTVDDIDAAEALLSSDIDYITSNILEYAYRCFCFLWINNLRSRKELPVLLNSSRSQRSKVSLSVLAHHVEHTAEHIIPQPSIGLQADQLPFLVAENAGPFVQSHNFDQASVVSANGYRLLQRPQIVLQRNNFRFAQRSYFQNSNFLHDFSSKK